MLIDLFLPQYDATQVVEVDVDAPEDETYEAIRNTDLRDPLVNALFAVRELPLRIARRWRGETRTAPRGPVTFGTMIDDGPGFVLLGEHPGCELVVGSVGKFWRGDYGGRKITGEEFVPFDEPGYAKLAISFSTYPAPDGRTTLRYEARTEATDDTARRTFGRYWTLIRPGVAIVMRRALHHIKQEAERRAHVAVPAG
jgi:hypothetical protein